MKNKKALFILWIVRDDSLAENIEKNLATYLKDFKAENQTILVSQSKLKLGELSYCTFQNLDFVVSTNESTNKPEDAKECSFLCRGKGEHHIYCETKEPEKEDYALKPQIDKIKSDDTIFQIKKDLQGKEYITVISTCKPLITPTISISYKWNIEDSLFENYLDKSYYKATEISELFGSLYRVLGETIPIENQIYTIKYK